MSAPELDRIHYSDWLALFGFIPEAEALKVAQLPNETPEATSARLLNSIRRAHQVAGQISGRSGLAPEVTILGSEHSDRVAALRAEPTFGEHLVGATSSDFAWVELRKLKAFQSLLNLEYVDQLVESAPDPEDPHGAVKFCLPSRSERPPAEVVTAFNPNANTFIVSSGNLDLRIVGNFGSEDAATGRKLLGFAFDFGLPQLSVVEYRGSYFIKNGYHRAFALLKKGHEKLPCLLIRVESLQATGALLPGFLPVDLILSDRAPLLSDFETAVAVTIPRRRIRAAVTIHGEVQVVTV